MYKKTLSIIALILSSSISLNAYTYDDEYGYTAPTEVTTKVDNDNQDVEELREYDDYGKEYPKSYYAEAGNQAVVNLLYKGIKTKKQAESVYKYAVRVKDARDRTLLFIKIISEAPEDFYKVPNRAKYFKKGIVSTGQMIAQKMRSLPINNQVTLFKYSEKYIYLIQQVLSKPELNQPKDYKSAILNIYNPEINYFIKFAASKPEIVLPRMSKVFLQLGNYKLNNTSFATELRVAIKNKILPQIINLSVSTGISTPSLVKKKFDYFNFFCSKGTPKLLKKNKRALINEMRILKKAIPENFTKVEKTYEYDTKI